MSIAPKWQPELRHVGYHLVIETDGALRAGRPLQEGGAHVAGHNHNSIGVCMIGTDKFTEAQWRTLFAVALFVTHPGNDLDGLNVSSVVGHRDLSPDLDGDGEVEPHEWLKTCPGFSVSDWLTNGCQPLADHLLEG
jgi:N-acetylmuramoyl-L-alanine amidase